jgi:hypothetical protein
MDEDNGSSHWLQIFLITNGSTEPARNCFVLREHDNHTNIVHCLKNLSVAFRNNNNNAHKNSDTNNNKSSAAADNHNRCSNNRVRTDGESNTNNLKNLSYWSYGRRSHCDYEHISQHVSQRTPERNTMVTMCASPRIHHGCNNNRFIVETKIMKYNASRLDVNSKRIKQTTNKEN